MKRTSTRFARDLSRFALVSLGLLLIAVSQSSLSAQTIVTWGPNASGAPAGGSGNWSNNLAATAFWTSNNGTSYQKWVNSSKPAAIFAGTAGTVTLTSAVSASGLTFDTNGYTIARTSTFALSLVTDPFGFSPRITVTNASDTATISAPLAGSAGVAFAGPGTVVLSGANTLTSGSFGLNLASSTVKLMIATGSLASSNSLWMGSGTGDDQSGGGGTFIVDNTGASGTKAQTLASVDFDGGDSTIQTSRVAAQNLTLTFTNGQYRVPGATANYVVSGGSNGTSNKIVLSGGTGFVDQGTFFGGDDFAWLNSTGSYVRAIAYGSDSGAVTTGSTASVASTAHVQTTGAITAQASEVFTTLKISGAFDFTQAAGSTLTVNGLLKAGGNAAILSGATLQASTDAELVIRTAAASDSLTITSTIGAAGTNALTKSGLGTLTLGGANTYTGHTYLSGGVLSVATLPAGTGTASPVGAAGTLVFSTGTLRYTGPSQTTTRELRFLAGGGTIDVSQAGTTLSLDSAISGANNATVVDSLVKSGAGTLALVGSGDNSGLSTVVSGGLLQLAKASGDFTHASGSVYITSGGTVQLAGTGGDQIYDGGTVTIGTGGAFDFNGRSETFLRLSGGGSITNTSATDHSLMTFGSGAFGSSTTASMVDTFSGVISDGSSHRLSLVKLGAGTQIFTGASTYTGTTTIGEGTLKGRLSPYTALTVESGANYSLNGANQTIGSLAGTGNVTLDTGNSLTVGDSTSTTFSGALKSGGSLIKAGSGTLTLDHASTFSGGTTISFGTVQTSHATALGTGAVTVRGASAILNLAGTSIANAIAVDTGGSVTGGGGGGAFTLGSGGTVSPGASIGSLAFGATSWAGNSTFTFQLNNATGTAGTNWDQFSVTGALTLSATSQNKITLALNTLDFTSGLPGAAANFNSATNYTFAFATASSGITGFDASAFAVNTSGLANTLGGSWSVGQSGNTLNLIYTGGVSAIPEPGTYALLVALAALGFVTWRRTRTGSAG